ncbi:probable ATP-dependent RNA helicase spindle-E [Cydia amplana]|uniref:probable ATP-dependent RNA helicase spindle-E n=1 Tax=Cydia amplana TaxID=1869771 RepID=UPI002FE69B2F
MDELRSFFNDPRPSQSNVVKLKGPLTAGFRITKEDTLNELNRREDHRHSVILSGTDYAREVKEREIAAYLKNETERDRWDSVSDRLESLEHLSSLGTSLPNIGELTEEAMTEVYSKYSFQMKEDTNNLSINSSKTDILDRIRGFPVVIIEGPTGCGKTTQVPQWILDDCHKHRRACKIIVTQPRRIAAMSIAKRVAQERGWDVGGLVGYQVGLENRTSNDTRIHYVTTGVLLQKLVNAKTMNEYTHIILDEVHERGQDMDFLLLVAKKLLYTVSPTVKVILMSATFQTQKFADYFMIPTPRGQHMASCIQVNKKDPMFIVKTFYLEQLTKFSSLVEACMPKAHEPTIITEMYHLVVKLVNAFEQIDVTEDKITDRSEADLPSVLIFLPGINEIEEQYNALTDLQLRKKISPECPRYNWWVLPLHSTITADEQVRVFQRAPPGHRKIILATNIAESSITVPDIKYVIDFCLMKILVADSATNFSTLSLTWASKSNCEQRAGRAGRVRDGRVYRLVPAKFYDKFQQDSPPEIVRCPLERLVLLAKMLDMGPPSDVLALAMDPPEMSNIQRTMLVLKEIGALKKTVDGEWSSSDGELTYMGRIMARLPLDVKVSKIIILGHIFGCLDDSIIMAAALSVKNVCSSPFRERLNAYNAKLTWADGSTSDCVAYLHIYKVWDRLRQQQFFKQKGNSEAVWARRFYVQLRALRELSDMVRELRHRLGREGIEAAKGSPWARNHLAFVHKVILAGAFYPQYFVHGSQNETRERDALRELNGLDPRTTVYLKNFPEHQPGHIYAAAIRNKVHELIKEEPRVTFDNNSSQGDNFPEHQPGHIYAAAIRNKVHELIKEEPRVTFDNNSRRPSQGDNFPDHQPGHIYAAAIRNKVHELIREEPRVTFDNNSRRPSQGDNFPDHQPGHIYAAAIRNKAHELIKEEPRVTFDNNSRRPSQGGNFPEHQPGHIYAAAIRNKVHELIKEEPRVTFDNNSRKVFLTFPTSEETCSRGKHADGDPTIPGQILLAVYKAVKARQLKMDIRIPLLPLEEAKALAEEMTHSRSAIPKELQVPRLPSIEQTYFPLKVTQVTSVGKFWVQYDEETAMSEFNEIQATLNCNKLLSYTDPVSPGDLVAAPFSDRNVYRARVQKVLKDMVEVCFYYNITVSGHKQGAQAGASSDDEIAMSELSEIQATLNCNKLLSYTDPVSPGDVVAAPFSDRNVAQAGASSDDETAMSEFNEIQATLNCNKLLSYTDPVSPGDLVAAPFSDRCVYRARVQKVLKDMVEIAYIDFGTFGRIAISSLRSLPPGLCLDTPPLAMPCRLAELAPAPLLDSHAHWGLRAESMFDEFVRQPRLLAKIYSVTHGVVSIELLARGGSESLNKQLVNAKLAIACEESYESKLNHDLRQSACALTPELNMAQIRAYDREQIEHAFRELREVDSPDARHCYTDCCLKGPFSPLEGMVHNLMYGSRETQVNIEWSSINSVLLDTEPQRAYERLLIAADVGQSEHSNKLTLRHTTLMPNVPGLPAIIALLFCPTAELRRGVCGARYCAALCGLGCSRGGAPLFPEHDLLVNVDADLDTEDVSNINHIRYLMDYSIYCREGQDTPAIDDEARQKVPGTIRDILFKLMEKRRKHREPETIPNSWEWNSVPEDELLEIAAPELTACATAYPLHSPQELRPIPREHLDHLKREVDKLRLLVDRYSHTRTLRHGLPAPLAAEAAPHTSRAPRPPQAGGTHTLGHCATAYPLHSPQELRPIPREHLDHLKREVDKLRLLVDRSCAPYLASTSTTSSGRSTSCACWSTGTHTLGHCATAYLLHSPQELRPIPREHLDHLKREVDKLRLLVDRSCGPYLASTSTTSSGRSTSCACWSTGTHTLGHCATAYPLHSPQELRPIPREHLDHLKREVDKLRLLVDRSCAPYLASTSTTSSGRSKSCACWSTGTHTLGHCATAYPLHSPQELRPIPREHLDHLKREVDKLRLLVDRSCAPYLASTSTTSSGRSTSCACWSTGTHTLGHCATAYPLHSPQELRPIPREHLDHLKREVDKLRLLVDRSCAPYLASTSTTSSGRSTSCACWSTGTHTLGHCATAYPLHSPQELRPIPREHLDHLKREVDKLRLLVDRSSISTSAELSCPLCGTPPMPTHAMRIHLYSNSHKEKEEDFAVFNA